MVESILLPAVRSAGWVRSLQEVVHDSRIKEELSFLVEGTRVLFDLCTPHCELDTIAFELSTVRDRTHRSGVLVQEVDLFEGQPLGLRYAEVGEQEASSTSGSPNEEHLDLEASRTGLLVDQVGGSVADTEVPEPVRSGGEGHCFSTDVEREDFTGDDPSNGTPGGSEEGNIDADESNQNFLSGSVRGRNRDANDGNQEFAKTHAGRTHQE